jgi:small neutral amino acid transporter SnatA (MarC family)
MPRRTKFLSGRKRKKKMMMTNMNTKTKRRRKAKAGSRRKEMRENPVFSLLSLISFSFLLETPFQLFSPPLPTCHHKIASRLLVIIMALSALCKHFLSQRKRGNRSEKREMEEREMSTTTYNCCDDHECIQKHEKLVCENG